MPGVWPLARSLPREAWVGLPLVEKMDGRSFVPLMTGKDQPDRDHVVTVYHRTAGRRDYLMRAVQDSHFGYIYNAWSDGKTIYRRSRLAGSHSRQ